ARIVEFRLVFRAPPQKFKILAIPDVLAHGKSYEHGFMKKRNGHKHCAKVEFRSVFRALSRKFKTLAIPDVLAHRKSYEHGFTKKHDGHKLCAKSGAESSFDRFFVHRLKNSKYWPFLTYQPMGSLMNTVSRKNTTVINLCEVARRVEFRLVFRAPSQKFKILAIPDVLAHGKLYEHGFVKKCDDHKLCAKSRAESSFNQFLVHCLGNSKYWPFPTVKFRSILRAPSRKFKIPAITDILARDKVEFRSVLRAPSRKFKILAILDVLAHVEFRSVFLASSWKFKILAIPNSRVSISFSWTISKIQNTSDSRCISP
ncbi:hypothetical protein BHM03_00025059, partial [Ensete ventricosum]